MNTVLLSALLWAMGASALAGESPYVRIVVQHAPLAGFVYYDGAGVWEQMKKGDPLTLVREPTNPHDPNAIRLEWHGRKLGYVPRRENADLARQIDFGARAEARITALSKAANGRHRVSYEISVPLR